MGRVVDEEALDTLFRQARTHSGWRAEPVSDETLHRLHDLLKWGPTSFNCLPMRVVFLRTSAARERLRPALMPANVEKTMAAPVTAIVAYDELFYEQLPRLFPGFPGARDFFVNSPQLADVTSFRNGSLQGGYFILAARAVGLDCGPMSGFDTAKVDAEFFSPSARSGPGADVMPASRIKSNFLCNLGHGDPAKVMQKLPRLDFEEACTLL